MKNEIALKVYEIDYSFIIKNYLDKELWHKEWTLFIYKNYVFKISLESIEVKRNAIVFKVESNQESSFDWNNYENLDNYTIIIHYLDNSNIDVLKKQINGAIFELIERAEKIRIIKSNEYKELEDCKSQEEDRLEEIAKDFLDKEGVTNENIRDAYINDYVSANRTVNNSLIRYKREKIYTVIPDVYLVFTKATNDIARENRVLEKLDYNDAEAILKQVDEYMAKLETEEYRKELSEDLESI